MKLLTTALLLFFGFNAYSQYGKLEPLKPGDTVMVLRTSPDSIAKIKRKNGLGYSLGSRIETIEESLNYDRALYLHQKPKGFYEPQLPGLIGIFQRNKFRDVGYYMKEYLIYHPDYAKDHTIKQ